MRFYHAALLAGLAATAMPALASETASGKAYREAVNGQVLFNNYPARALAAREQGLVAFKVSLDRDGQATTCVVTHSSGYPLLDRETCDLVLFHMEFKPVKDSAGRSARVQTEGVVNWKLPGTPASARLAAPVKMASASAPEKKICKRTVRTGTLAGFERTCMTKREWDRATDESRQPFEELQGRKGMTAGQ